MLKIRFWLALAGLHITANISLQALEVATTSDIITDWVTHIGGKHVSVTTLTQEQAQALSQAKILFAHGLNWEPWLKKAASHSPATARQVILADGLNVLDYGQDYLEQLELPRTNIDDLPPCCQADAKEENKSWETMLDFVKKQAPQKAPTSSQPNPYLWHDVNNAMSMVVTITDILAETDPENADYYDQQADAYLSKLQALDSWIKEEIASIAPAKRILIAENDGLRYFARRYGLITPCNTASKSLPTTSLASYAQCAAQYNSPVIFTNRSTHSEQKENAGQQQVSAVSLNLSSHFSPQTSSYETLIRSNTETIVNSLSQENRDPS